MLPEVGSSIQFKHRRKVLLPEPDGPSTATISPLLIVTLIPFRISLSPKLFLRLITSITLLQAPFQDFYKQRYDQYKCDIDQCHHKIRYHKFITVTSDIIKRNIKICCSDETDNRSLFYKRNKLISKCRKNILDSLWNHDLCHTCPKAQTHGTSCLHLSRIY